MYVSILKYVRDKLVYDLKEIDVYLRVKIDGGSVFRSNDKCFNLSRKYPKGNSDGFHGNIEEHHPSVLLFHVKNAKGNIQEIITESTGSMCMDRLYYADNLDRRLRSLGKNNIVEENLFILHFSVHAVAL